MTPCRVRHFSRERIVVNENVDDLTVQYEENGLVVIKELDKVILSRGAWATHHLPFSGVEAGAEGLRSR